MYACGPTVYDSAHLGHARAYLTLDVMRRILEDYFHYDVNYVMNITDIDDKIIMRARRDYLVRQYLESPPSREQIIQDARLGYASHIAELQKSMEGEEEDEETALKIRNSEAELERFEAFVEADAAHAHGPMSVAELVAKGKSGIAETLDQAKGASVRDHSIFLKHTQKFEAEFF